MKSSDAPQKANKSLVSEATFEKLLGAGIRLCQMI